MNFDFLTCFEKKLVQSKGWRVIELRKESLRREIIKKLID